MITDEQVVAKIEKVQEAITRQLLPEEWTEDDLKAAGYNAVQIMHLFLASSLCDDDVRGWYLAQQAAERTAEN